MPLRLTLFVCVTLGAGTLVRGQTYEDRRHKVRIYGPAGIETRNVSRLVSLCADEIGPLLRPQGGIEPWLDVYVGVHPDADIPTQHLALQVEDTLVKATHAVLRALIQRAGRASVRRSEAEPSPHEYDWLVGAMCHSLLHCPRTGITRLPPNYEPIRNLFRAGKPPFVRHLLEHPVSPEWALHYELFSLNCHLLVTVLTHATRQDRDGIGKVVQLVFAGRSAYDALTFVFREYFAEGETLQSWYERRAVDLARAGRESLAIAQVEARLRELSTVRMVLPGIVSGDSAQGGTLDELPELLKDYEGAPGLLAKLQSDVYELARDAPPLLGDALLDYVKAFQMLDQGKRRHYLKQLKLAEHVFAARVVLQQRIQDYVDDIETELVPGQAIFPYYFEALRDSRRSLRQVAPDLHAYLDSLE